MPHDASSIEALLRPSTVVRTTLCRHHTFLASSEYRRVARAQLSLCRNVARIISALRRCFTIRFYSGVALCFFHRQCNPLMPSKPLGDCWAPARHSGDRRPSSSRSGDLPIAFASLGRPVTTWWGCLIILASLTAGTTAIDPPPQIKSIRLPMRALQKTQP